MSKPAAQSQEKLSAPPATMKTEENVGEEEGGGEDDFSVDDWDAFQSFPVSANDAGDESNEDGFQSFPVATNDAGDESNENAFHSFPVSANDAGDESKTENATEDPILDEASHTEGSFDDDGIQGHSESKSENDSENPEEIKEEVVSNTADVDTSPQNQPTSHESTTEQCDIPSDDCTDKPQDIEPREEQQLEIHEVHDDKEASIPGTELVSGDNLSDKETKGSVEGEEEAGILLEASDSTVLKQSSSESGNNEQNRKRDSAEE